MWERVIIRNGTELVASGDHASTDVNAWDAPGTKVAEAAARDWLGRKRASHVAAGYAIVDALDSFTATKTQDGKTKLRTILIRAV